MTVIVPPLPWAPRRLDPQGHMTVERNVEHLYRYLVQVAADTNGGGEAGGEVLGGARVPNAADGDPGDWWMNTATGVMYGPKAADNATWPTAFTMIGPQGPAGTAGAPGEVWYTGTTVPTFDSPTANVGDWYLRSTTGDYYERTSSINWTLRGNLKGPAGPTGPEGPPGADGEGAPVYEQAAQPTEPVEVGALWIDTDEQPYAWSSGIPLVTSLPTTGLRDGQEVYYLADATNGIIWHLRYRASSASAYKWEVIAGPPLQTQAFNSLTVAAQADASDGSVKITLPLAGDYLLGFTVDMVHGIAGQYVQVQPFIGAASLNLLYGVSYQAGFSSSVTAVDWRWNGVAAGAVAKLQFGSSSGNATVRVRTLTVRPVRVG